VPTPRVAHRVPSIHIAMESFMPRNPIRALLLALCLAGTPALAQSPVAGSLTVEQPWARPTARSAPNGAVYLTIANAGPAADRLVQAHAEVSAKTELHTHLNEGGVMRMRPVTAIDIPAGGKAELKPGGLHVMLLGLKAPLAAGTRFPLTLTFETSAPVTVTVTVQRDAAAAGHGGHAAPPPSPSPPKTTH
jgi:copper(I)-binding protein